MLLSDKVTGGVVATIGGLAFAYGSQLPPVPGQQVGPSAFPMVVGAGLVLCGGLIVFGIGRHFEEVAEADVVSHATPEELAPVPAWRNWLALLPPALLAFYALASETLGFLPTTAIMVLICSLAFGAKPRLAVPLAIIAPFTINLIFLKLLRVPLPGGILPFSW
ncbi:Putative tricarboxylic transport membrane protein OS=Bosea thiooxidans OX=53254 GN=SAMN05660750_04975 PE=4 SV=1 [Bosea thiooxidans]|uniref:Putative tricarboxylic transport membrane protein n=1 Tax=Bosea thiooxidans TaxID=53254 RepID=A0A1T5H7E8_9HYPH|nr:tripartite tricarboxylate transporter TctB family protein [Bosea thiooxidans]SKC16470.1 putative tricarboxylic transport membrane protein [Bosea thiooxidans]